MPKSGRKTPIPTADSVFDRHPGLQVIAGHWGEVVLFYVDHTGILAPGAGLGRPLIDYFRQNFWVAGSGTVSERYHRWTAEVVGTERMMYSTDYPYTFGTSPNGYPFLDTSNGAGGRSWRTRRSPTRRRRR